ncbi:hypothetical protein LT493_25070 [Streptomyces tricolor]|nr:hypothetical protein [Streptomyces tricolor]
MTTAPNCGPWRSGTRRSCSPAWTAAGSSSAGHIGLADAVVPTWTAPGPG